MTLAAAHPVIGVLENLLDGHLLAAVQVGPVDGAEGAVVDAVDVGEHELPGPGDASIGDAEPRLGQNSERPARDLTA